MVVTRFFDRPPMKFNCFIGLSLCMLATVSAAQDVGAGAVVAAPIVGVSTATGVGAIPAAGAANVAGNSVNAVGPMDGSGVRLGQTDVDQAIVSGDGQARVDGPELAAEPTDKPSATPNEFARFVAQSAGRELPVYGADLFRQPGRYAPVMAAPVPDTYVLGPGDELVAQTFGSIDLAQRLVIDREGKVTLPKVGPVRLAGLPFSEAQKALDRHLARVFKNYTLTLTMGRVRSLEVFVLGQAAKPGKHVVSGMSTLINALFETGGASAIGSLRKIELRRGGRTITRLDLYDFLAKGQTQADARLQSGDIIYIPPVGPRAAILGTVNAPAIYELLPGETVQSILALTGGLPVLAAPQKAQLERLDPQQAVARYVEDFSLDDEGLKRALKDGDVLTVFQVSPQIANVVTLQGNVASPMRYSFKPGMKIKDLLSSSRLLIPARYWLSVNGGDNIKAPTRAEVNLDYATLQRLDASSLTTRLLAFSPIKAIAGDPLENLSLQSGDIITVYAPSDAGPPTASSVTLKGELVGGVRRFPYRPGMTLKDLIPSPEWLVDRYQYWQQSSGKDLRSDINWDYAQLVRRLPLQLKTEELTVQLGPQVLGTQNGQAVAPIALQEGDELQLFTTAQVAVPVAKRSQFVTLSGEVAVPGRYQLKPGETLPQLVARAGGFTRQAYVYGTVFTRERTRVEQQRNLDKAVRRAELSMGSQSMELMQNSSDANSAQAIQANQMAQKLQIESLRALRASGRVALNLDVNDSVGLPAIQLEEGDTVTVPSQPDFVGVAGAVFADSSFIYEAGKTVGDYLDQAGLTRDADVDSVMLVRADGTVESNAARTGFFNMGKAGFFSTRVNPGDSIFVPELVDRRSFWTKFMQNAKDWTQLVYQFGLGAAALRTLN